jgi:creatinine amidohydrolase
VNTGQLDIKLTLNVMPSTQLALLRDLGRALLGQGIRKLVILNGHGGNDFRGLVRELQGELPALFVCTVNWWTCLDARPYFAEPGDHAGELETSVMQHVAPALVRPLSEAGSGRARRYRVAGIRDGWAWAPRRWTEVTTDTGVGDPAAATPEKGARFLAATAERIAGLLVDLHSADLAAMYES